MYEVDSELSTGVLVDGGEHDEVRDVGVEGVRGDDDNRIADDDSEHRGVKDTCGFECECDQVFGDKILNTVDDGGGVNNVVNIIAEDDFGVDSDGGIGRDNSGEPERGVRYVNGVSVVDVGIP
jgi:hypothetical protein